MPLNPLFDPFKTTLKNTLAFVNIETSFKVVIVTSFISGCSRWKWLDSVCYCLHFKLLLKQQHRYQFQQQQQQQQRWGGIRKTAIYFIII